MALNLDAYVQDVQPSVGKVVTYYVTIDGGFIHDFTERFSHQVEQRLQLAGAEFSLSAQQLNKYLNTLLYCRVQIANLQKPKIPRAILKTLNIPAIHQLALNKIGWVKDFDTAEEFLPRLESIKDEDLLSIQDMVEVSSTLGLLADFGIEVNPGLSLDREGNLGFMTWKVVTDSVKTYWREDKKAPASDAILLSLLKVMDLENVIRPKFYYGNQTYYESLLQAVFIDSCRIRR